MQVLAREEGELWWQLGGFEIGRRWQVVSLRLLMILGG